MAYGDAPPGQSRMRPTSKQAAKQRQTRRRQALGRAHANLSNALTREGLDVGNARNFASILLSRPGVIIGRDGKVRYRGKMYDADGFATTELAKFVTGKTAEARNRAAIEGDPGYLQALAELDMGRDLGIAGLDEQRRRAILDFGDPSFTEDSLLGAQARANPFSTSALLARARAQEESALRQGASRMGTLFGGGYRAGQAGVARANAARQTEATRDLQDLLAGLNDQAAATRRAHEIGRTGALQETTQRLLSTGAIHAARPPSVPLGGFRFWTKPKKPLSTPDLYKTLGIG